MSSLYHDNYMYSISTQYNKKSSYIVRLSYEMFVFQTKTSSFLNKDVFTIITSLLLKKSITLVIIFSDFILSSLATTTINPNSLEITFIDLNNPRLGGSFFTTSQKFLSLDFQ